MAQGKLSQQIAKEGSDSRITRTQKKRRSYQQLLEQRRFEALKTKAQETQAKEFSNISTLNEYEEKYDQLSSDIKEFFQTPTEVQTSRNQRIASTIGEVSLKMNYADEKIAKAKQRFESNMASARERYDRDKKRDKEKARERLEKYETKYENDFDETVERWRGYKKGLSEAQSKLNKGEDLSFNDIENYASDLGRYYQDREEARNNNQEQQQEQQQQIDSLIQKGYKPMLIQKSFKGTPTSSSLTFYNEQEKKYSKLNLQLNTKDVGKFEKSQIKTAKISQSFNLGGKTFKFETIAPVFKKPSGQLVTSFGDLGTTEAQAIQSQRDQFNAQEKEYDKRASDYLASTGFKDTVNKKVEVDNLSFWEKIKAAYISTPFGTSVPVPDEYNRLREERTGDIFSIKGGSTIPKISIDFTKMNTLSFEQSVKAVQSEDIKQKSAEKQIELIEKLSTITENAPEDLQYYVQAQGFSQLSKAGVRAVPTKDDPTQIEFISDDWKPSKSFNIYQWEKENSKIAKGVLGTRIVSTEALKMYGIGKAIGGVLKGSAYVGSKTYQALGGGLKITDISIKGGSATATATLSQGAGKTGSVLKTVGMGAIGLGVGGLYTYSKVKQYQYQKEAFGKAGQQVFFLETGGELLGFGALAGESAVNKANMKKLQTRIQQENYLKEARAEGLKNIKDYGKFSKSAKLSYRQAGVGQDVLSKKGMEDIAKQYSKITGVSQKEAAKLIAEKGIYEQVFKVKSSVPSYERALKFLKTGKAAKTTTNYYSTGRFGIFSAEKTAKGSSELAFDFKLSGRRPTNIILKATQSKGNYAITNVFEKARYSPKNPTAELRLKDVILTKATSVKSAKVGDLKFTRFDIENRILKSSPLGKQRLTLDEALKIGNSKISQDQLKAYWKDAGSLSRSSSFSNIRIKAPLFKDAGGFKVAKDSEYLFSQVGTGKSGLPMKNPRLDLLDDALREIKKQELRNTLQQSRSARGLKGLDFGDQVLNSKIKSPKISSDIGKMVEQQMKRSTQGLKDVQISPTIQAPLNMKSAVRLENIPAIKNALNLQIAAGQSLSLKSNQKLKQEIKTKQKTQQSLSLRQAQDLELSLRQGQQQRQQTKQSQSSKLILSQVIADMIQSPTIRSPTPTQSGYGRSPKIVLPTVDNLKKILKQRSRQRKTTEDLYYLPDFTSRAVGLAPIQIKSLDQANKLLRKTQTGLEVRRGVTFKIPKNIPN